MRKPSRIAGQKVHKWITIGINQHRCSECKILKTNTSRFNNRVTIYTDNDGKEHHEYIPCKTN